MGSYVGSMLGTFVCVGSIDGEGVITETCVVLTEDCVGEDVTAEI